MIHKILLRLSLLMLLPLCANERSWTSSSGTTITATLVSQQGAKLTLRTVEGREIQLNKSQLSAADQQYLESLTAAETAQPEPQRSERRSGRRQRGVPGWENWDEDWPKLVKTSKDFEISEGEQNEKYATHAYVYHSPHFTFYSDARLNTSLVKKFAWYFESSRNYLAHLPLTLSRTQETQRHEIVLYEHKEDYHKNGGPESSAGVYMGGADVILVPFVSVGMKKVGSGYAVDHDGTNKTLSHEIVHSYTDGPYYAEGSRGWFTEGLADYVGVTPYRSGIFQPSRSLDRVRDYVTAFDKDSNRGRNIGTELQVGSLEAFMMQPYSSSPVTRTLTTAWALCSSLTLSTLSAIPS